ncbi:MAG: hypothetical protein ACSLEL_05495 [Candidatus Malihini olakiniferum]
MTLAQITDACRPYRYRLYPQTLRNRFPTVIDVMHYFKGIGATPSCIVIALAVCSPVVVLQALAQVYPASTGGFPFSYHLINGMIYRD